MDGRRRQVCTDDLRWCQPHHVGQLDECNVSHETLVGMCPSQTDDNATAGESKST